MEDVIKGRVFKYGDHINTDVIYPGKYTYQSLTPEEMASHALEDLDPDFHKKVRKGDVIVAGKNFGMGSSREQAASCLKYAGVSAVIAKSFARIFFRNAINNGLLVIESKEVVDLVEDGDEIEIDMNNHEIRVKSRVIKFPPIPPNVKEILKKGGLIPYLKEKFSNG